jgi:flagellar hook assembly protein FlgD
MFSVAFRGVDHQEAGLTLEKVEVGDRSGKVYIEAAKVNATKALPKTFSLSQNNPNPFNPSTTISYEVPESSGSVKVVVAVYNIRGQKVITLVDGLKEAGQYSINWNGRDENGRRVSSGVYFYRMNAGDFTAVRKMVIVK